MHVLEKESDYRATPGPGISKLPREDDVVGESIAHSTPGDGKSTYVSTESNSVARSKSAWLLHNHHHQENTSPSSVRESIFQGTDMGGAKTPVSTGAVTAVDQLVSPLRSLPSTRSFTAATFYNVPASAVAAPRILPAQERVVNSTRNELRETPTPESVKRRLPLTIRTPSISSSTRALTGASQEIFSNINSNAFFVKDDTDEWRRERQIDGGSLSYALLLTSQIATTPIDASAFPNLPIAPKLTSVDPRFSSNMLQRLGQDTIPRLSIDMYWKIYPMYHDDAAGYREYVERWYNLQEEELNAAAGGRRQRSIYTPGDPPQDIFNRTPELASSPILRSAVPPMSTSASGSANGEGTVLPWPSSVALE